MNLKQGGERMTDSKLLRKLIMESGLKYYYIAECLGISRFCLSKKIDNKSEFKISEALKLAKILKLTEEQTNEVFFRNKVEFK